MENVLVCVSPSFQNSVSLCQVICQICPHQWKTENGYIYAPIPQWYLKYKQTTGTCIQYIFQYFFFYFLNLFWPCQWIYMYHDMYMDLLKTYMCHVTCCNMVIQGDQVKGMHLMWNVSGNFRISTSKVGHHFITRSKK